MAPAGRASPTDAATAARAISTVTRILRPMSLSLRRLPAATRTALLTAAALSDPTTALVDEDALRPAEEEDIVTVDEGGHILFRHPLYASAVYGSASRAGRRALHASLAEGVTDPEERARHLAAATTHPDETVACALDEGAVVARSRGAWGSAADGATTPPRRRGWSAPGPG